MPEHPKRIGGLFPRNRDRHPPPFTPGYRSSVVRAPQFSLVSIGASLSELTGPVFGHDSIGTDDNDLTRNHAAKDGSPIGERMIVYGRIRDETGRGIPSTLVEIWQANAGGRYHHPGETYHAPLDPNFGGCGRTLTDDEGWYEFRTIKPGPYPWPNGVNDWRPAHIHFSLFGQSFAQRLITQMYFEGDPLIRHCPIVNTIADQATIDDLVARLDLRASLPMDLLAYRFDLTLRGRRQTYFENTR
ncbi:MAG: protocatechuate 3,4-dioxygenase subunit beta [Rhodobacteraceae bacterium]|nr:protocatechuate 3,4-dioxygenase subunit beta [Paracoccaceae bacterium]